jgi:hypothetical protein
MSVIAGSPACRRLREDLELLAIPDNPTVHFERRFFPRSKLITLFTRVTVEEVLLCQCLSCTSRIQHPKGSRRPGLCDTILGRAHSLHTTAILLFALLLFIECPQLISCFLEASCSDAVFEKELSSFTEDRVRRQYWPIYDEAQPDSSRRLAEQFRLHKYKFAIPCLTDQAFATFDESTILPFFNEKWLGKRTSCGEVEQEGAYGRVFSFEILDEYRDFKVNISPDRTEVVKRLPLVSLECDRHPTLCAERASRTVQWALRRGKGESRESQTTEGPPHRQDHYGI